MIDQPNADGDLQSLWQEQPSSVDASALLRRIERLLVSERRYLWVNTGLLAALLALTIWMEWIGAYRYAGPVVWWFGCRIAPAVLCTLAKLSAASCGCAAWPGRVAAPRA